MRIGIYAGSFDPLTNGHLDIFERANVICDKVIIAVAKNITKKTLFNIEERVEMIKECCGSVGNSEVTSFNGLLIDYCREKGVSVIIRGIRAIIDFDYEYAIALLNRRLLPEVETIFLVANSEYSFISSSMVKEVAGYGGDVSTLVPQFVNDTLAKKLFK